MDKNRMLDGIKKAACRGNSLVMDAALKIMPETVPEIEEGIGSAKHIPNILRRLGITNAAVVTGPTVGRVIAPPILEGMERAGIRYTVYDQVEPNPSVETVENIRAMYKEKGCNGFLAIGGGSPMDAAKAAAAMLARPGVPLDKMAGLMRVHAKIAPIVAVPTTAGTGSEVTMGAVVSNHKDRHKYALMDPCITPKYAVLDPELTTGMPRSVTATTGMDALTHAVESYVTWAYNTKKTNRYAEQAVVKIFRYIERAYADGSDMEAREQMLLASTKAGLAFNRTGVGYIHAISHALSGLYNVAHGLANAVILPIVLEDYGEAVYPHLAHLAELTGVKITGSEEEKARAFIREIRDMNARMGIPEGFDFIKGEDHERIVSLALKEANWTYPVPVLYNEKRCGDVLERIVLRH